MVGKLDHRNRHYNDSNRIHLSWSTLVKGYKEPYSRFDLPGGQHRSMPSSADIVKVLIMEHFSRKR